MLHPIGIDTETHMIRPGTVAPKLVCVSGCPSVDDPPWLLDATQGLATARGLLTNEAYRLVIHNAAFDLAVFCAADETLLPVVFEALAAGRVSCTLVREKMLHNAQEGLVDEGKPVPFDLASVVQRRCGADLSDDKYGEDSWRTRYSELDGIPIAQWPDAARKYAADDAMWHLRVYESQEIDRNGWLEDGLDPLKDEPGQVRAAFCLHLMGCWGVRTDEPAVQALIADLSANVDAANVKLLAAGLLKGKSVKDKNTGLVSIEWAKDTKKIKALIEGALGDRTPKTEPSAKFPEGQTKTDEETLRATGNPDLIALADVGSDAKVLSVWGNALQGLNKKGQQTGLRLPTGWLVQPKWNVLVSSGRTSVYDPPVQQLPRKGDVRPCFVPRSGYWYLSVDYSFVELVTWAQSCLDLVGFSQMAEAIKAGLDPHVDMGAEIMRAEGRGEVTYESLNKARKAGEAWAKDARQLAKAANFGLPGGLGAETFIAYAHATYGVDIAPDKAWGVKKAWMRKWPEAEAFFAHVSALSQEAFGERFRVTLPRTGFVRGGCTYTSGCNCVDYETEALTKRGWVSGHDINMDDYILTKNADTGALEWQKPLDVSHFPDYHGPVISFESTRFSAVTTPNHRWLVNDHKTGEAMCVVSEKLSRNGDHRIHRTGNLTAPDHAHVSDDELELIGWFLTDGSLDKESTRCRIVQKKVGCVERIDGLFARLGNTVSRRVDSRGLTTWSFSDKPRTGDGKGLARMLRTLFPKRILTPNFVTHLSRRQAEHLLNVMLLGDGTRSKTFTHFFTHSKDSADAVQMLATLAGWASNSTWRDMSRVPPKKYASMPNIPKMTGCWVVRLYRRNTVQVQKHHVTETTEARGMWCPSVPNTYFVARRKNTVYVTGNTYFQGLAARGAKEAMFDISRECYADESSPLFGSRPVLFIHDEFILEVPAHRERAHLASERVCKLMVDGMSRFTPDVPVSVEPTLMPRWYKDAGPVWGSDGVLELWHPKEKE